MLSSRREGKVARYGFHLAAGRDANLYPDSKNWLSYDSALQAQPVEQGDVGLDSIADLVEANELVGGVGARRQSRPYLN